MAHQTTQNAVSHEMHDENSAGDSIDLRELWRVLWVRKWNIVALAVGLTMIATLVVYGMTPVYRASSKILIEQKGARILSIEQVYGQDGVGNEYLQTQFELLRSQSLARRVVRKLQLHKHPDFEGAANSRGGMSIADALDFRNLVTRVAQSDIDEQTEVTEDEIIDLATVEFMKQVEIKQVGRSQLVMVHVDMTDPVIAAKAANALAEGFIEDQLNARMEMSLTATNWMNERLSELRDSLIMAEARLQEFRDHEGIVDVGGIKTVSAGDLNAIRDRMVDARRLRSEAESEFNQVRAVRNQGLDGLTSIPAVLTNPLIQSFKSKEASAVSRLQELSSRYGPRHPTMEAARNDLVSIRESLTTQVNLVIAGIERRYQLAVANEDSLRKSVEQNIEAIQDISRKEFRLRELQREVDTNRTLYDTFMTRLKEASATSDMDTVNARIVDRASVPILPIKPRKMLVVLIAAFLGTVGGMALAILMNSLNNTFNRTDEVEHALNLPVMGVVPKVKESTDGVVAKAFMEDKNHGFAESIRTIRTGVMLSSIEEPHKVLVVTSSVPGEGKSTLASNLAYAFSKNEKVILVEGDMRRPTMARNLGLPPGEAGLANAIAGNVQLEKAIRNIDGLDVIFAGVVPPNPLELLSTARFAELVNKLLSSYDRIVIDSPPVQAVSDALILATHANAVIYVVKAETTSKSIVQSGVGRLLQSGAPVIGVVLNHVDVEKARRSENECGGYYDYYGYASQVKA